VNLDLSSALGSSSLRFNLQILDSVPRNLRLHHMFSIFIYSERPVLERPLLRHELRRHTQLLHIIYPIEIYGRVPRPRRVQHHSVRCTEQNPIRNCLHQNKNKKSKKKIKENKITTTRCPTNDQSRFQMQMGGPDLESVGQVDDEGGVVGANADPLVALEHLQAADLVLVADGEHLGVGVRRDAEHFGRVRTGRVVVHARVADGVVRLQARESVRLQAQPFRQALHHQARQVPHGPEVAQQITSTDRHCQHNQLRNHQTSYMHAVKVINFGFQIIQGLRARLHEILGEFFVVRIY
jgi:hypothetical protein